MIDRLPQHIEDEIQRLVDSGEYEDSTDVLVQGVHLLSKRRDKLEQLRELLQVSVDQYERGEFREYSQELLDERWESALARYNAGDLTQANVRS